MNPLGPMCAGDGECLRDGRRGACVEFGQQGPPPGPIAYRGCLYSCRTDTDCRPDEACACHGDYNECVRAECHRNSDCADGHGCQFSEGFFCHTREDECRRDADCRCDKGTCKGGFCYYDRSRWACFYVTE